MKTKISPQTFAVTVQCSFPEEFSLEGETTRLEQKRKVRCMSVPGPHLGHENPHRQHGRITSTYVVQPHYLITNICGVLVM